MDISRGIGTSGDRNDPRRYVGNYDDPGGTIPIADALIIVEAIESATLFITHLGAFLKALAVVVGTALMIAKAIEEHRCQRPHPGCE
jgi:hypothetical protein